MLWDWEGGALGDWRGRTERSDVGILRGGRRCTGELGGVYWGLGGKQAHQGPGGNLGSGMVIIPCL